MIQINGQTEDACCLAPAWTEAERLAALERYAILDTPAERAFDDIARLAADFFDAPIAGVNLLAHDRQWFKAQIGIGTQSLPLHMSICAHALPRGETMVVPDTHEDDRFGGNPLVTAEGGLRFYAGALLKTPEGLPIGTVCVLDRAPRPGGLTDRQRETLEILARQAMAQIELRAAAQMQAAQSTCLAVEIEEHRRADVARRRSEQHYRTLFDSIDAGFCIIDMRFDESGGAADYHFVDVNPAFERQTGLRDVVGRSARELVPGLEQHWFDTYGQVARDGVATRFELPATAMDERWFDVHAFRIDEAEAQRVAILFNDISVRRRAEVDLQRLNDTLEQRVAAAVAEREQAQDALRQSQKMEAMGQLTGGVAHDFNNLLTPIIGSLDLLQRRSIGNDRERRLIGGALQSAERAKTLVQRLLAFARRQPLQPTPIDLAALVRGMSDLLASTSGPQTRIQLDLAAGMPPALADANQLEMALLNLCVNARDAMPGGGTLTISAAAEAVAVGHRSGLPTGSYLRLSVADTGVGMTAETLTRAIEPFFSTKGIGKGTGLGLSMVHGLASQLGGGLAITSRSGFGTCIDLWLPEGPAGGTAPCAVPEIRHPAPAQRGRALVVDDEDAVRMTTGDMLCELGYDVIEAASADQAQQMLEAGLSVDLIVTDHLMPGLTGAELARSIRLRQPHLPVLLVSGYAEAEGIAFDMPRLTKPFRQADLAAMVTEIVGDG